MMRGPWHGWFPQGGHAQATPQPKGGGEGGEGKEGKGGNAHEKKEPTHTKCAVFFVRVRSSTRLISPGQEVEWMVRPWPSLDMLFTHQGPGRRQALRAAPGTWAWGQRGGRTQHDARAPGVRGPPGPAKTRKAVTKGKSSCATKALPAYGSSTFLCSLSRHAPRPPPPPPLPPLQPKTCHTTWGGVIPFAFFLFFKLEGCWRVSVGCWEGDGFGATALALAPKVTPHVQ